MGFNGGFSWVLMEYYGCLMGFIGIYPLVMTNIAMKNRNYQWEHPHKWLYIIMKHGYGECGDG